MDIEEEKQERAYHRIKLSFAQDIMGIMFDIIHYETDYTLDEFMEYFIKSGLAFNFGRGNAREHGRDPVELIEEALERTNNKPIPEKEYIIHDETPAFWAGWILTFYQWYTNQSFEEIHKYLKMENIIGSYILHEASEFKFVDLANKRRDEYYAELEQNKGKE